ncbi:MAG: inositol monophosphatase [Chloroflexi bacterium]|nr:inositol monophosphatase [Chloroflexota bacterium]MBT3995554.1 inositol monophosphatase [Chloroflexota bacterium]MBT4340890.1 inositol monophosphatase [Chloroflexota bacterium]MBT4944351.1 inositol monophosphatase [Chloroflexota bacterium]MBT5475894.1 inositol monophosphatase [Chloroflexota bacterium]
MKNSQENNELDLQQILKAADSAATAASEVLMARFRPNSAEALDRFYKSPNALVTDADLAADKAITEALIAADAPGRILSEESETKLSDDDSLTWLVDPLCGTVPFSTGMDHWGVNIALRKDGDLIAASLPLPSLGERLSAIKANGVIRNGELFTGCSPIQKLSESAIGLEVDGPEEWRTRLAGDLDWIQSVSQINTFASAAYPIALVCLGRLPAAVFYGIEPMHFAAGAMIASELGVLVTDELGAPIDWSKDDELSVVVIGWPVIHEQLLAAMAK